MSTTLTNGLKLPDKGSVDWYADMQSNYTILDGAVGTVAQHTTQIAGKAPAVHTHTKADITDLFNSDNTWSGNNTFTKTINSSHSTALSSQYANVQLGAIPSTDQALLRFQCNDKDNDSLCYFRQFYQSSGTNTFQIFVRNKFANGTLSTSGTYDYAYLGIGIESDKSSFAQVKGKFIPYSTNTYDLGSSSYQWNNLYAKSYYYNGTAWGLDKANVWTGENIFNYDLLIKNANATQGTAPSSNKTWTLTFCDSNKATTGQLYCQYRTNGSIYLPLRINNGTYDYRLNFILDAVGYTGFNPSVSGIINLGSSNYKWKTLNGINPGALSLPNGNAQDTSWIGDLTIKDGSNYNLKTFALNGWITINIPNTAGNLVVVNNGCGQIVTNEANGITGNNCAVFMPVVANVQISILLVLQTGESVKTAIFAPCLGNV